MAVGLRDKILKLLPGVKRHSPGKWYVYMPEADYILYIRSFLHSKMQKTKNGYRSKYVRVIISKNKNVVKVSVRG